MNNIEISNIKDYKVINSGEEGIVYKYNDSICFKEFKHDRVLRSKESKIKKMMKLDDNSFCFPLGRVTTNNNFVGYYMKYVDSKETFKDLEESYDYERIKELIIKASICIERLHQSKLYRLDCNLSNILIKDEEPIFVDTDNYKYKMHAPEFWTGDPLLIKYGRRFSDQDKDIFLYTMSLMQLFAKDTVLFDLFEGDYLNEYLSKTILPSHVQSGLIEIFSDSKDKPYLHYMLQDVDPKRLVLK